MREAARAGTAYAPAPKTAQLEDEKLYQNPPMLKVSKLNGLKPLYLEVAGPLTFAQHARQECLKSLNGLNGAAASQGSQANKVAVEAEVLPLQGVRVRAAWQAP